MQAGDDALHNDLKKLRKQQQETNWLVLKAMVVSSFHSSNNDKKIQQSPKKAEPKTIKDARLAIQKEKALEKRILENYAQGKYAPGLQVQSNNKKHAHAKL